MRPLRGAPLACCMYCLVTGVPRTEEHLIPRALGGRATLRDAVCEPCRRITGRLEQATLDREFVVPKTLLALKRRRARGKGPSRLPPVTLAGDDTPSTLTADAFPRIFSLAAFEPAGLLAGIDRANTPPRTDFVDCRLDLGTPTSHTIAATPPLPDPTAYAWAIAKWAYALAVAERGLQACDTQALRDLMLGRRDDVFAFVGTPSPRAGASREWLHDFAVRANGPWLAVTLALFASAGMTPFEVVIGRLLEPAA
ncbi:hypothetical protein [Scleromatobacter humisilvae]|uniref:HNH endonuclease n=1 Tax=Scleromatobacter humisilvae TaxID=2897159 RepID=A0A9X2C126_9BURK|nr:hypothetical protein [Scleromatobacter humisilvae]MCK9687166.1 HNH endonuclease [Scleromatobacter humisilvae]